MKKISVLLASIIFSAIAFTGCFDQVFYDIMQDVPPEEPTVNGVITSIARYDIGSVPYLVTAANGGLRYKHANYNKHGGWNVYGSLPFEFHHYDYYGRGHEGQQIIKVLADSEYLYLISVSYKQDDDEGSSVPDQVYVWAKKMTATAGVWDEYTGTDENKGWKNVTEGVKNPDGSGIFGFYKSNSYTYSLFNVFSSNSPKVENRVVFIRSGSVTPDTRRNYYYRLDGLNAPVRNSEDAANYKISDSNVLDGDSKSLLNSCQWLGSSLYFFNSIASCTNETLTDDATLIYYGVEKELYVYNGTDKLKVLNAGEEISCLAATKDALLIGRADFTTSASSGGLVKTSLTDAGIPGTELVPFTTNAGTQLPASYLIFTVLAADPSLPELDCALYSSIGFKTSGSSASVSYKNVGLWSYYKERANWNRE